MRTLKDFTPEIRAKVKGYISRAKDDLYSGVEAQNWKKEYTVEYVDRIYTYSKKDVPVVIVANSPGEYVKFYDLIFNKKSDKTIFKHIKTILNEKRINGKSNLEYQIEELLRSQNWENKGNVSAKFDNLFLASEYSRVYLMWYRFIHKEFDIPFSKSDDLEWFYSHVNNASISRCYFTSEICLVLRMPSKIIRNEIGFHSAHEPAIQFADGYKKYYLNGRAVPEWVFDNYENGTLTFEMFNSQENEDIKAAIITLIKEREGNEGLIKFLDVELVDEQVVHHENGYSEILKIWKTKNTYSFLVDRYGNGNQPYAFIEMICPSTKQTYLIDTCPTFTDAVECAKWHRPKAVPESVSYIWQSAN